MNVEDITPGLKGVKAWRDTVTIPTYEVGAPEKNPIFLEKRVYQGSSGVVYPYPVIEKISDVKTDHEWKAVFLENEYIKVMILPELGGRVQMAYDKIRRRHFVYYNHVIKPALVGLAGPWISGGIEFNWPQHHRPSTYMPVDSDIERNADGSVTVWVNETERMFHQRGMAGFTLRPGRAYLEIKGRVYNGTELPQTFLWWANPAVAVNDRYRSVFPPDINAVFDHGKRAVSSFPIATGTYYKMDYSAGVDIANYKNIFVPTSYMAVNSKYDFEGGYEEDTEAGMLHVASHHVSPGKKQWTWGNGDFGRAWDRCLTDDDGPYIELMAGVYTENQPDFTWLMPYEEKEFTQYFMPYRELGMVKNASKDILMSIVAGNEGEAVLKVYVTSRQKITIKVADKSGDMIYETEQELSPEKVWVEAIHTKGNALDDLKVEFMRKGRTVLEWSAEPDEIRPIPDAAEAAKLPHEIKTVEQLYLTGLHLEQYRHATYSPVDYYEEGLRRDSDDVSCNNALGKWYLRKGRFEKALPYLEKAVRIQMKRNPNPYDGEPIYNLGLALKGVGRSSDAYARFYKSTWNGAWQDAGYYACALISTISADYEEALYETERSLARNVNNPKARALKGALLFRLGRNEEATEWCEHTLRRDPFNYGCLYLLGRTEKLTELMHGNPHNYDELALDFAAAGLCDEADGVWRLAEQTEGMSQNGETLTVKGAVTAMTWYYWGYTLLMAGRREEAGKLFLRAAEADPAMVFPNRWEAIHALRAAIEMNPGDANAHHYLGNLFYDKRQYDLAQYHWEMAGAINPEFPTTWRNLALLYYNKSGEPERALEAMERAFLLDPTDARVLMELDQLHKKMKTPWKHRLERLQHHRDLTESRDDLILEEITLLNQTGAHEEAKSRLDAHIFHPWEGGEGKVPFQYQTARVELAKRAIAEGRYADALKLLEECLEYPHHLGEGKLYGAQENDFHYLMGLCHRALGHSDAAREAFRKATEGPEEPAPAMYYNDAKPDKIFYAGLAWRALGDDAAARGDEAQAQAMEAKARGCFNRLVSYGKQHLHDKVVMDYFAVSLPDLQVWDGSLDEMNRLHCLYMLALGYAGLGDKARSDRYLSDAEAIDMNHQGVQAFRSLRKFGL